jgi:GNAT superfamily N-acetyltransferase
MLEADKRDRTPPITIDIHSAVTSALMKTRFLVKLASEEWEFEQIHRLNHQTFAEEIPQHPANASGRLIDKFHGENVYVIALDERRLVGMAAVRTRRPFSLDQRLPDLDTYLPAGRSICELRLLAIERRVRSGGLLPVLLEHVWRYAAGRGFDLAVISGITRQIKLYRRLGFVPFGPLVGTPGAQFQPMMLTRERFAPIAARLFRDERTLTARRSGSPCSCFPRGTCRRGSCDGRRDW